MPANEEMPTPEGPLAPSSTYPRHDPNAHEHGDQTAAVQHIYDAESQLLAGETPELFPPQPTESESLFGDRSSAGPLCLDDETEFISETSAGLTRGLPSAQRSIGNDLTNLDQVRIPPSVCPILPHVLHKWNDHGIPVCRPLSPGSWLSSPHYIHCQVLKRRSRTVRHMSSLDDE